MSERLMDCKCCGKQILNTTNKRYCSNCAYFIKCLTSRLQVRFNDRCKKCRKELEAKYKYISRLREPVNNVKKEDTLWETITDDEQIADSRQPKSESRR